MKVLVDTSIWSLALRRKITSLNRKEKKVVTILKELLNQARIVLIGPIRQEILSGIKSKKQFNQLKEKLAAFENFPIQADDYELAAELYNLCRKKGVQGSYIDFLICAVAINNNISIFTTDKDFITYAKHLPINIFKE